MNAHQEVLVYANDLVVTRYVDIHVDKCDH